MSNIKLAETEELLNDILVEFILNEKQKNLITQTIQTLKNLKPINNVEECPEQSVDLIIHKILQKYELPNHTKITTGGVLRYGTFDKINICILFSKDGFRFDDFGTQFKSYYIDFNQLYKIILEISQIVIVDVQKSVVTLDIRKSFNSKENKFIMTENNLELFQAYLVNV